MERELILEELLENVENLLTYIESYEADGEDLTFAHELVYELKEEIEYNME